MPRNITRRRVARRRVARRSEPRRRKSTRRNGTCRNGTCRSRTCRNGTRTAGMFSGLFNNCCPPRKKNDTEYATWPRCRASAAMRVPDWPGENSAPRDYVLNQNREDSFYTFQNHQTKKNQKKWFGDEWKYLQHEMESYPPGAHQHIDTARRHRRRYYAEGLSAPRSLTSVLKEHTPPTLDPMYR